MGTTAGPILGSSSSHINRIDRIRRPSFPFGRMLLNSSRRAIHAVMRLFQFTRKLLNGYGMREPPFYTKGQRVPIPNPAKTSVKVTAFAIGQGRRRGKEGTPA
jgi:hypothetical protein